VPPATEFFGVELRVACQCPLLIRCSTDWLSAHLCNDKAWLERCMILDIWYPSSAECWLYSKACHPTILLDSSSGIVALRQCPPTAENRFVVYQGNRLGADNETRNVSFVLKLCRLDGVPRYCPRVLRMEEYGMVQLRTRTVHPSIHHIYTS